jgi:hypothetical protein
VESAEALEVKLVEVVAKLRAVVWAAAKHHSSILDPLPVFSEKVRQRQCR